MYRIKSNRPSKTALAGAMVLALSSAGAYAANVAVPGASVQTNLPHGNFTMLNGNTPNETGFIPSSDGTGAGNGQTGGTNTVNASWDGTVYTENSDFGAVANMTLSSTTLFFGHLWTAKEIQVFAPGTYSFTYTDNVLGPTAATMVVPPGRLGIHMLFDWNNSGNPGNSNIDVFQLAACNAAFNGELETTTDNPPRPPAPQFAPHTASEIWELVSVDTRMPDGPFAGSNSNFNLHIVVPADQCETRPDQFTFTDQTGVTPGTLTTSNAITVGKTNAIGTLTYAISISGNSGQYEIDNSGTWTSAAGTISRGQTVRVRQTSSPLESTILTTTLTIGGRSDTFLVDTGVTANTCPDSFSFTDQTNVATGTLITSDMITVNGITTAAAISISNGTFEINNSGSFGSAGTTVVNGNTVRVRHTSAATGSTATNTVLTIDCKSDTFTSTTAAAAAVTPPAETPSSPGCSLSPRPVEPQARAEWWLVGGFLVWLGMIRRRVTQYRAGKSGRS